MKLHFWGVLAFSLGLFACEGLPLQLSGSVPPPLIKTEAKRPLNPSNTPISARMHRQGSRLRFEIALPDQAPSYGTKALDCGQFERARVSIRGAGIATPIYSDQADTQAQNTEPISGCHMTLDVSNVPSGTNRVAVLEIFRSSGSALAGTTLSAVFDLTEASSTVYLSYRSTPAGQVVNELFERGLLDQALTVLAADLNNVALQTLLDTVMGTQGDFGSYSYLLTHPSLVDYQAIVDDVITSNGNFNDPIFADPAHNPNYVIQTAAVSQTFAGMIGTDQVSVRIADPVTLTQNAGNSTIGMNPPPGSWDYTVTLPPGYSLEPNQTVPVGFWSTGINPTEGSLISLGTLTLYPLVPSVNSLSTAGGAAGNTVLINGSNFHHSPAGNTVFFGNQQVPSENIRVISASQLEVQVPSTLTPADYAVSVNVGSSMGTGSATYTVYPPTNWTGWSSVISGSETEHILSVATPVYPEGTASEYVYFGSKVLNPSEGGIWRCTIGTGETCTNKKLGSEVGSIQALAIRPDDPHTVFAGSETQGIYLSIDDGQTWTQDNTGLDNLNVRAVAIDPLEPDWVYAATANGVYRRDSDGPWEAMNTGLNHTDLHALAIYRPHLAAQPIFFAGTQGGGVYRYQGGSWATINTGLFEESSGEGTQYLTDVKINALAPHPTNPALLYGGGIGGYTLNFFFFSYTWRVGIWQRTENGAASDWNQLARNGTNGYCGNSSFAPSCFGVVGSSTGLVSMDIAAIALDPLNSSRVFTATQRYTAGNQNGGIFRSNDAGATWSQVGTSAAFTSTNALAVHPAHLYAGTNTGLFRAN